MTEGMNLLLAVAMLSTLALLGVARLRTCARLLGLQGLAVGLLPLLVGTYDVSYRIGIILAGNIAIKTIVFPVLLLRACRTLRVRRDPGSFIGFGGAVVLGTLGLGLSGWLGAKIAVALPTHPAGVYIVAFFLIITGLLIIIVRRRAVMQVIGYLTMENGIYLFGSCAAIDVPFLLEFGVMLDVFAAVFVMGAALQQIHRHLESDDATQLAELRG